MADDKSQLRELVAATNNLQEQLKRAVEKLEDSNEGNIYLLLLPSCLIISGVWHSTPRLAVAAQPEAQPVAVCLIPNLVVLVMSPSQVALSEGPLQVLQAGTYLIIYQ